MPHVYGLLNKLLSLILILGILVVGYLAIEVTHISASFTMSFGEQLTKVDEGIILDAMSAPVTPAHKPKPPVVKTPVLGTVQ